MADKFYGYGTAGLFGYSHLTGGYAGGQAEYVRVPYADVDCFVVPAGIDDEKLLFLGDIFPTGYMAAENCDIKPGHVIAVFGCGPVGQFAIRSCFMLGAERVIAIDDVPERLAMARAGGAEILPLDGNDGGLFEKLNDLTVDGDRMHASTRWGSRGTAWAWTTSTIGPSRRSRCRRIDRRRCGIR